MGQISLPVSNRTGYSMFWQSVWDSKLNYNRNWKEDHLIRLIVPFIFINRFTIVPQFTNLNTFKLNSDFYNTEVFSLIDHPSQIIQFFSNLYKQKKKLPTYILKIWIMKFQKWIILYFHIYSPIKTRLVYDRSDTPFFYSSQLSYFFSFILKKKYSYKFFYHNKINYESF